MGPKATDWASLHALWPQWDVSGLAADTAWTWIVAPAGSLLFVAHTPCAGYPMLVAGEVEVTRPSPEGRRILLYTLAPGDGCMVSTAALCGGEPLGGEARARSDCRLLLLHPPAFQHSLAQVPFRNRVMGGMAQRLADLGALVDGLAFHTLDQRLAHRLLGHGPVLSITHQGLADELGTVREVVSRLLRRFERAGWVALGREQITILNPSALRAGAESPGT